MRPYLVRWLVGGVLVGIVLAALGIWWISGLLPPSAKPYRSLVFIVGLLLASATIIGAAFSLVTGVHWKFNSN
jgi:ABC-type transport system involved in cytochrome c biogenesis permease subunit